MNVHPMAAKHSVQLASSPFPSGGGSAPATSRTDGPIRSVGETFLGRAADQYIVDCIVEDIVDAASDMHIQRIYKAIAVEYTACALWAEMVSLVKSSVVPFDSGYRTSAEIAASECMTTQVTSYHDPWRPDIPPQRIITEDHSRRVVQLRPATNKEVTIAGRKRRAESTGGPLTAGSSNGSRPVSTQSGLLDDRNLLNVRRISKSVSRGSVDGASHGVRSGSLSPSTPSIRNSNGPGRSRIVKAATVRGELELPTVAPILETLSQPEFSTDESEIIEHQETIAKAAADRDDALKRSAKISKTLSDPKAAPKNFTIDGNGNVIPVVVVDDSRPAALIEAMSPRFQVPQSNLPPPPPDTQPNTKRTRVGGSPKTVDFEKKKSREPKKDETFVSTDARDVPMQIKVAPSGGVSVKDSAGPPRTAELKIPAAKMSKADFLRLRGIIGNTDSPTPPVTNAFGLGSSMKSSSGFNSGGVDVSEDHPSGGNAAPTTQSGEASGSAPAQLPAKRSAPPPKKSDPKGPESARKPAPASPATTGVQPPTSARLVTQAPAPPPKRNVAHQPSVNTKKVLIESFAATPVRDKQLANLAETWTNQRTVNLERERVKVTITGTIDADLSETI